MPKPWIVRKVGTNKTRMESPLGSISRVGSLFGRYREVEISKKASVMRNFHRVGGKEEKA